MADIYDLVQREFARRKGRGSQFADPISDIALQLPGMIQSERDRAKVQNRDSLSDLLNLL